MLTTRATLNISECQIKGILLEKKKVSFTYKLLFASASVLLPSFWTLNQYNLLNEIFTRLVWSIFFFFFFFHFFYKIFIIYQFNQSHARIYSRMHRLRIQIFIQFLYIKPWRLSLQVLISVMLASHGVSYFKGAETWKPSLTDFLWL